MSDFKPGDVVMLKSGGPAMTVSRISLGAYGNDSAVYADWFGPDGKSHQGNFAASTLRPAQKTQVEVNAELDAILTCSGLGQSLPADSKTSLGRSNTTGQQQEVRKGVINTGPISGMRLSTLEMAQTLDRYREELKYYRDVEKEQKAIIKQLSEGPGAEIYIHPHDMGELLQNLPLATLFYNADPNRKEDENVLVVDGLRYRQSVYTPRRADVKGSIKRDSIMFPVVHWSDHDFFFVQYRVYVRKTGSNDKWRSFTFDHHVLSIKVDSGHPGYLSRINVELVTGDKHVIMGGPNLDQMWTRQGID